jgi:hypothetical protein
MIRLIIPIFFLCSISVFSQTKIAILPFSNLDGNFDYNKYCYELQDSLTKAFIALDPENKYISIVPASKIDALLEELNITANSPSFDSDK